MVNKPTIIDGNLVLTEDTTYKGNLVVKGNISGKAGEKHNLTVKGDISAVNISVWDISARDISAENIIAWNISARDIFYDSICFAHKNIKCKSIHGRCENSRHFVLDGKITIEE